MTVEPLSKHNDGKHFTSVDFSQKSLDDHSFSNCTFHCCNFSKSLFRNAAVTSCSFVGCNLSLGILDVCHMQDIHFLDCKIVGVEFFKCCRVFFSVTFKNCLLQYCNFSELNMKSTSFSGSKIKECYFTNTCLNSANFNGTELSGTSFHNCDLCRADFSGATQYSVDPCTNKIKKAKFSLPEVIGLLQGFDIIIS